LIEHVGSLLAAMPTRVLSATVKAKSSAGLTIEVTTKDIGRVDIAVDGHPLCSQDVTDAP
jgi:hypothetical protein